ncbi:hypothetical protein [Calothrix sp. NIES-2100]|uniref:hypothetical protein n=1 Tax=Calothrix sp. NIES-2100 TaxID=1954172 RepID=UPI0030D83EA2
MSLRSRWRKRCGSDVGASADAPEASRREEERRSNTSLCDCFVPRNDKTYYIYLG